MDDTDGLAAAAGALADAVEAAVPAWVEGCVDRVYRAWAGRPPAAVVSEARAAGVAAAIDVGSRLRALLEADIDAQRTTPLAIVREATAYPAGVLAAAGVPPVRRDEREQALFPDDAYHLGPASFADLDPRLNDLAIAWGAAKARAHRRRHGG